MGESKLSQFLHSRWLGLVAGMWALSVAGSAYTFAIYSPVMKSVMGYNQVQVDTLAVAKDFGEAFGILAGFSCNCMPSWLMLVIGACHNVIGFGGLWLVISQRIPPLAYWKMLSLIVVGSQGTTWMNTAVLVTCVRNFPKSRGTVVGILKGLVGLSAAIYTQIYTAVYSPNAQSFLILVAFLPLFLTIITMHFIKPISKPTHETEAEEYHFFHLLFAILLFLATYLMAATILQNAFTVSKNISTWMMIGMIFILILPMIAPIFSFFSEPPSLAEAIESTNPTLASGQAESSDKPVQTNQLSEPILLSRPADHPCIKINPYPTRIPKPETLVWSTSDSLSVIKPDNTKTVVISLPEQQTIVGEQNQTLTSNRSSYDSLDSCLFSDGEGRSGREISTSQSLKADHIPRKKDAKVMLAVGEGAVRLGKRRPRRGEDFTIRQAIVKADFWLLFSGMVCGCGSGLAAINNLAQMAEAQGFSDASMFVSMVSIWNFVGRLSGGIFSEQFVRKYAVPRNIILIVAQCVMSVGHIMFAIAFSNSMYYGTIIVGLCYGVHWAIMPSMASELFGLKHFGIVYNTLTVSVPVGSYLFSDLIAGYLYDRESSLASASASASALANVMHSTISSLFRFLSFDSSAETEPPVPEFAHRRFMSNGLRLGLVPTSPLVKLRGLEEESTVECVGAHCFRLTFFIMAVVCLTGALFNLCLALRTKTVYKKLYGKGNGGSAESRNESSQIDRVESLDDFDDAQGNMGMSTRLL